MFVVIALYDSAAADVCRVMDMERKRCPSRNA